MHAYTTLCLLYSNSTGEEMHSQGKLSRKYDLSSGGEVVLCTILDWKSQSCVYSCLQ